MANTRTKTGALKNMPRFEEASTKAVGLSSASSPFERAGLPADAKKPEKKCRQIAEGEFNLPNDKPPRRPDDGTVEALPMDIILEILSYLHPLDLLQLARTSQIFRDLLMSKRSCHIWRAARSALGISVPECPPDQSEPQWARLIFDLTCQICHSTDTIWVEWALRLRGCAACRKRILIFEPEVPKAFPGIKNMKSILNLLPFIYQGPRSPQIQQKPTPTKRADRWFYRPAIQPMINLYQSHKEEVLAKVPGAKERFNTFTAETKQNVIAILNAEGSLKSWGDEQDRLRAQEHQEEILRWQMLYRKELVALGHHQRDAHRASMGPLSLIMLRRGWEKNRVLFERAASRIKGHRLARERSSDFHGLYRGFLAQTDRKELVRGLWPSSRDILEADPQIEEILRSGDEESYQDELKNIFPTVLDQWWELKKDILVEKILDSKPQESPAGEPEGGWPGPNQNTASQEGLPPQFDSAYAGTSGPTCETILELAKSVFSCTCQPVGWLKICPIYFDRGLTNHRCFPMKYPYKSPQGADLSKMQFDALSSSQVDAVCAALGLEPSRARFIELDELDARFRCLNCPYGMIVMNWRVAIKHRHSEGKASQCLPPMFTKISDEEAAIVRAFELDNPDRGWPVGRIRSSQCDRAFYTTNELLNYLNERHGQTELAPDSYWVDPSIPPKPVQEMDVFGG